MAKSVIIVESPAKTKTIRHFLGPEFDIAASIGHVRDLPEHQLGVDVEHDFRPTYRTMPGKRKVITDLSRRVQQADTVYLATDPDREGEAIAWHLQQVLKLKNPRRIEFNEITSQAVRKALAHPRDIDLNRVHAQQARRILDRLVGYKLSPLLWRKVKRNLSAGRVQSVAVRLICEREREIQDFVPEEYWTITATLTPSDEGEAFRAKLELKEGKKLKVSTQAQAQAILEELKPCSYLVDRVQQRDQRRNPPLPFITSTLQRAASQRLRFSAKQTMRVAQSLYEGLDLGEGGRVGLITYMRTDSTRVAQQAQKEARQFIEQTFGPSYRPSKPRRTRPKKGAQDAHEAIRPTSVFRRPEEVKPYLTAEQYRLYALIWETFVASQMSPAILHVVTVDIAAGPYTFRARGTTVKFPGFLALTGEPEPAKEGNGEGEELNKVLPPLSEGQSLTLLNLEPQQHFTKPPPRYTEAALVKALEEEGIGRPSTYAQILGNIVERGYVVLKKRRFHPTPLGFTVTDQLVRHFPDIMDVKFTAAMEEKLDRIERGEADWVAVLREFYGPFEEALRQAERNMQRVEAPKPQPTEVPCPECGAPMVIRQGRYGEFLSCSTFPRCKGTRPLNQDQPPAPRPSGEVCEKCGAEMVIRTNRRGEEFLGCSAYPKCRNTRSLPQERFPCPTPKCSGYLVPRRGPRGRFYGCSRYPECTFTTPYRPTEQTCPQCGWPLGQRRRRGEVEAYVCVNRECGYTAPAAAEEVGEVVA